MVSPNRNAFKSFEVSKFNIRLLQWDG